MFIDILTHLWASVQSRGSPLCEAFLAPLVPLCEAFILVPLYKAFIFHSSTCTTDHIHTVTIAHVIRPHEM